MRFFKSRKGDLPTEVGGSPSNTPNKNTNLQSHNAEETYKPPAGPPPSYQQEYGPPFGPPPSHFTQETFEPPPGPPPSHSQQGGQQPVPYHDWTAIPDTSLLPPPPSLGNQTSPTSNAELTDAIRAHRWCEENPLYNPHQPSVEQIQSAGNGEYALIKAPSFNGNLSMVRSGVWRGHTKADSQDTCLLTSLPLYFEMVHSPFRTEASKTFYFEVTVRTFGRGRGTDDSSLALGFCAVPYPTWRMPGWERGSLAVHSDDGRRYVNDTDGGKDFTAPIQAGETVGIGITYAVPASPPNYEPSPVGGSPLKAAVFFTRNGNRDHGWDLHEELDAESEFGVLGLDGKVDLYGAVGTFGEVVFEASFHSRDWLYQPR